MAASNTYFHMPLELNENRHIELTARGPEYGMVDQILDNMIQLTVYGPIYGTSGVGDVGIWLTEKDQNDLIAGILERRGIYLSWEVRNGAVDSHGCIKKCHLISSDNNEQSSLHPAKTK